MFTRYFLFFVFCLPVSCLSQHLSKEKKAKDAGFLFVPVLADTSGLKYVRTLQGSGKYEEGIFEVYKILRSEANRLKANCFKLRNFSLNDSARTFTLILAVYSADDLQRRILVNNHESNMVFLFCDDRFSGKKISFKLNKQKITIPSGNYYRYSLKNNEEILVSKGGSSGGWAKIKWMEEGPSYFFVVEGMHLASPPVYFPGAIGIGISQGKVKEIEYNFGFLLTQLLKVQEQDFPVSD